MSDASLSDIERAEYQAEVALWRAHAEALAGAAHALLDMPITIVCTDETEPFYHARMALRAALARLPADALAERRALEELAEYVRDNHEHPDCDEGCLGCRYLAALDAARTGSP